MTQKDDKKKKDNKKQIDDTMLEWYNLTDEDIEKIKNDEEYTLEELEKSLKVQWFIEDTFGIKITDTDFLLNLYNTIFSNVQSNLKKTSRQASKIVG